MALYSIGEVAALCNINPVTLRAWQRRYGLLKPKRSDGGHRLFDSADIERIREIQTWIEQGVQVSKVKSLLSGENREKEHAWGERQETLLRHLQSGNPNLLRAWIADIGRIYPAHTLVQHLYLPLRRRLYGQQIALCALLKPAGRRSNQLYCDVYCHRAQAKRQRCFSRGLERAGHNAAVDGGVDCQPARLAGRRAG